MLGRGQVAAQRRGGERKKQAQPVGVDDGAFIDTSFPGFAALMRSLGASIA